MRSSSFTLAAPLALVFGCYAELPGSAPGALPALADTGSPGGLDASAAGTDAGGMLGNDAGGDTGAPADAAGSCEGAALGALQSRVRYEQAQVLASGACRSETQVRSCSTLGWSPWSGSFAADSCNQAAFRSCGAVAHGSSELRQRFFSETAGNFALCLPETQARACSDGVFGAWSGSARFERCAVSFLGVCNPLSLDVGCGAGTVCLLTRLACVGTTGHVCSANSDCQSSICAAGACVDSKVPNGGACDEASDCAACSNAAAICNGAGRCVCDLGAICSMNSQCNGTCAAQKCVAPNTTCDGDDDCDAARSKCAKAGPGGVGTCLLEDGEACATNAQCKKVCRPSDDSEDFTQRECAAPATDGKHCDENADCESSLVCRPWPEQTQPSSVGTHCQKPAAASELCDETADCAQSPVASLCKDNLCVAPVPSGTPCTASAQCQSGVCADGAGTCE